MPRTAGSRRADITERNLTLAQPLYIYDDLMSVHDDGSSFDGPLVHVTNLTTIRNPLMSVQMHQRSELMSHHTKKR